MKHIALTTLLLTSPLFAFTEKEAKEISMTLKKELLMEVQSAVKSSGFQGAVETCHEKALPITNKVENSQYKVYRTSLKYRNPKNAPSDFLVEYLQKYQSSTAKEPMTDLVVNQGAKKLLLSPLYTGPVCLNCHGNPQGELKDKIKKLYPKDLAIDYKLGEFRGFVVVEEK